jgi:hypothetical protein
MSSIGMEKPEASNLLYQIRDNIKIPLSKKAKLKGGKRKLRSKKNKKRKNKAKTKKYNK